MAPFTLRALRYPQLLAVLMLLISCSGGGSDPPDAARDGGSDAPRIPDGVEDVGVPPVGDVRADVGGRPDVKPLDAEGEIPGAVWESEPGGPYTPTPIAYGDYIFFTRNTGVLNVLSAATLVLYEAARRKGLV